MPRNAARSRVDTLNLLRDRAFVLFGRFGYEGVSIGDIAKAAHLSKGALYWHYDDKLTLYLDCQRQLHTIFNEYIFDPMRAQPDGVSRILLMFNGLGNLLLDPRVTTGVAGFWLVPGGTDARRILEAQRRFELTCFETMRETLALGVSQGRFDYRDDLDEMARAIIALVEAVVLPLRHQSPEEVRQVLGVLARSLFRAYATADDLLKLTRAP